MFPFFAYADRADIDSYLVNDRRTLFLPGGGEFDFDLPNYMWDVLEAHAAFWRTDLAGMIANMVFSDFEKSTDADARRRRYLVAATVDCVQQHFRRLIAWSNDNWWREQVRNLPEGSRKTLIHNLREDVHRNHAVGKAARQLVEQIRCANSPASSPDWVAPIRAHHIAKKRARQGLGMMNIKERLDFTSRVATAILEGVDRLHQQHEEMRAAEELETARKAENLKAALTAAFFSDAPASPPPMQIE